VDFCATAGSLALKLSEHRNDQKVAILLPANEEELIDIYSVQDLFHQVPVMLVLPNRDEFVEAMGHRLKPKLMIHKDSSVVKAVSKLHNMVGNPRNFKAGNMPIISE
jgi:flagellar biosynthesis regulator FlbT